MSERGGTSRVLLVEGVPGLGKTTVVDGVLRRYVEATAPESIRTALALAQTHTYGPLVGREDDGSLTKADNLAHLETIVGGLDWLVDAAHAQPRTKCVIVVDTLHLTHCLRPGVLDWPDVAGIDARLADLGARLLLLDATDETVRQRTVAARAATEFIHGYALGRFGRDEGEIAAHFCRERDRFRALFTSSVMSKRLIAAEAPAGDIVEQALEFWLEPRDVARERRSRAVR